MVDNIRIVFKDFHGSLEQCSSASFNGKWVVARLHYSDNYLGDSPWLKVMHSIENPGILVIEGSIRKWYYGENNLKDLTRVEFSEAISNLASRLSISECDFLQAKVSRCEIGLNINVNAIYGGCLSASDLLPRIACYRSYQRVAKSGSIYFARKERASNKITSRSLGDMKSKNGRSYEPVLRVYDKTKEIKDSTIKGKHKVAITDVKTISRGYMRIEFIVSGKAQFLSWKLGVCQTLGGIKENYDLLGNFFLEHSTQIGYDSPIDENSIHQIRKKSFKRKVSRRLLRKSMVEVMQDLNCAIEMEVEGKMSNAEKTLKLSQRKDCLEVSRKYCDYGEYNWVDFVCAIYEEFVRYYGEELPSSIQTPPIVNEAYKAYDAISYYREAQARGDI